MRAALRGGLMVAMAGAFAACDDEEPEATEEAVEEAEPTAADDQDGQDEGVVEAQQPEAEETDPRIAMMDGVTRAVAVLHPTDGNEAKGTVQFTQTEGGVQVVADIEGLEGGSRHGFHVHMYGDCSAPDGTSAGGHYDPQGHPHELPDATPRHAGDMGNVEAGDDGSAHFEQTFDNFTLGGREAPVLGRGVILHAQPDTGEGESGEAGPRIACGVIGIGNAE